MPSLVPTPRLPHNPTTAAVFPRPHSSAVLSATPRAPAFAISAVRAPLRPPSGRHTCRHSQLKPPRCSAPALPISERRAGAWQESRSSSIDGIESNLMDPSERRDEIDGISSSRDRAAAAAAYTAGNVSKRSLLTSPLLLVLTPALSAHPFTLHGIAAARAAETESSSSSSSRGGNFRAVECGVQVVDVREGTGAAPVDGQTVSVHYYARLGAKQGWRFDSTYEHKDRNGDPVPFEFVVGSPKVIEGLSVAVRGMRVGGVRRAVIPPNASYQTKTDEPLPPRFGDRQRLFSTVFNPTRLANGEGSTLGTVIFDIQLLGIRSGYAAADGAPADSALPGMGL